MIILDIFYSSLFLGVLFWFCEEGISIHKLLYLSTNNKIPVYTNTRKQTNTDFTK